MIGSTRVAVATAVLLFGITTAIASAPPGRASEAPCEPRSDPLHFTVTVDPPQPQAGDEVSIIVGLSEVDGLLLGHALVDLHDASPVFDDPPAFRQDGLLQGPVVFTVHAGVGGTAELTVTVNYETECACPPPCFYRRTVVSEPFTITVAGPTATPTVECTPPSCAGDEVFSCPEACPGGCGTICATRTPTACPTPACAGEEVLACPGVCPGGCGLICAVRTQTPIPATSPAAQPSTPMVAITLTPTQTPTLTPTSNRPRPVARGRANPNPARSGETVTLDGSESTGAIRSAEWVQSCGGPKVELASSDGLYATFVVPPVSQETTLTFTLTLTSYGSTSGDRTEVDVTVLPPATVTPAPRPKRFAFVASSDFCSVWGIDLATNTVYATIRVGAGPNAVAIAPDGQSAYVANGSGTVSVIDTATSTVSTTIAVDSPSGIAVAPDGKQVYVTSSGSSSVSVIDTSTQAVVDVIALLPRTADPLQIAFTPSGEFAYVTTPGFPEAQSVSVINTATNALVTIIPFPQGAFPEGISVTADGRFALVTNSVDDSLSVIDTTTNTITTTVPVGHSPVSVAVSPNGAFAYVANLISDTMSVVDIPAHEVSATVPVASPAGVAIAPDGRYAYVSNLGLDTVSVVDTQTHAMVTAIPVGNMPRGIAIGPGCAGDCNASGDVTIDELILMVSIALGNADVSACPIADADDSGTISVDRIVAAVNSALAGCP